MDIAENGLNKKALLPYDNVAQIGEFLDQLAVLPGAEPLFMGECSVQAQFKLANGKILRIGSTDDDVAAFPGQLWADVVSQ